MARITHGNQQYRPQLDKNGKMDVRTGVSYGPAGSYTFGLAVYVRCIFFGAKDSTDNFFDIPVWRGKCDQGETREAQKAMLEFQCNLLATQQGLDYALRLPHLPKDTPKSYFNHARRK